MEVPDRKLSGQLIDTKVGGIWHIGKNRKTITAGRKETQTCVGSQRSELYISVSVKLYTYVTRNLGGPDSRI
jgi:hypothetical protein